MFRVVIGSFYVAARLKVENQIVPDRLQTCGFETTIQIKMSHIQWPDLA